jgi:hypothetical protein
VRGALDHLVPARRRLNVDLDHAGIRRDAKIAEARIARRLVALEDDRLFKRFRRGFDRRDQFHSSARALAPAA